QAAIDTIEAHRNLFLSAWTAVGHGERRPQIAARRARPPSNLAIFPVPPLQQLGIRLRVRGVVDRAAKYVEHATVDMGAAQGAKLDVEFFGSPASEIRHPPSQSRDQSTRGL